MCLLMWNKNTLNDGRRREIQAIQEGLLTNAKVNFYITIRRMVVTRIKKYTLLTKKQIIFCANGLSSL